MTRHVLLYDHSFEGFLTAVYRAYEQKYADVLYARDGQVPADMFAVTEFISTNYKRSDRVLHGLITKSNSRMVTFLYRCFLSEEIGIENKIATAMDYIFFGRSRGLKDYTDDTILHLHRVNKMIGREVHRMHAFVRYQELGDGTYAATVEPDFDVMPLIGDHFVKRYPAFSWIIYDTKRKYGIHWDQSSLQRIELFDFTHQSKGQIRANLLSEEEWAYQNMWQQYFLSANIQERNNTKLHLRHVPKRYWKYLIEKQPRK